MRMRLAVHVPFGFFFIAAIFICPSIYITSKVISVHSSARKVPFTYGMICHCDMRCLESDQCNYQCVGTGWHLLLDDNPLRFLHDIKLQPRVQFSIWAVLEQFHRTTYLQKTGPLPLIIGFAIDFYM